MTWEEKKMPIRDQVGVYEVVIFAEGIEEALERRPLFCRTKLRRHSCVKMGSGAFRMN